MTCLSELRKQRAATGDSGRAEHAGGSISPDAFERIKAAIPTREAAEYYGFRVNRHGRMPCPFHNGRDPNLRVYPGDKGYHCFVCGATGDVIDFTARLFRLDARQAARRLNEDFRLGLPLDGHTDPAAAREWQERRDREARERAAACVDILLKCAEAREIRATEPPWKGLPAEDVGAYAELLGRLDYLDYYLGNAERR